VSSKATTKRKRTEGPVRASVSFDQNEYAGLKKIAEYNRVSIAWVVREAVAGYLSDRTPLHDRKGPGGGS